MNQIMKNKKGAILNVNDRPNGVHITLRYSGQMASWICLNASLTETVQAFKGVGFN